MEPEHLEDPAKWVKQKLVLATTVRVLRIDDPTAFSLSFERVTLHPNRTEHTRDTRKSKVTRQHLMLPCDHASSRHCEKTTNIALEQLTVEVS
jgi:hypothetical protein